MISDARFGRSIGWGTISVLVIAASQLIFMAAMARLLSPADFGLVAMAGISLRFATYFAQLGVGPAIIQKPELTNHDIGAATAVSVLLGGVFTVASIIAAPLAEIFFDMPNLSNVTQVLALGFLLNSFGIVALALLRRHLRFKALAVVEITAYVVGYGAIGLVCALNGLGVWSLVIASLTQMATMVFLSIWIVGFDGFHFRHKKSDRQHFLSFGKKYSAIGFIEFLSFNVDSIVVGKLTGQTSAGYYNRAMLLANLPVQQPVGVLTKVLLPSLSRIQGDKDSYNLAVQTAMIVVGFYAFTASAFISSSAGDVVAIILGKKWDDAAPILSVLALGAGPFCISNVAGVSVDARALLRSKLILQGSMLVLMLFLMVVMVPPFGVIGAAFSLVFVEWIRMVVYLILFNQWGVVDKRFSMALSGIATVSFLLVHSSSSVLFEKMAGFPPIFRVFLLSVFDLIFLIFFVYAFRPILKKVDAINLLLEKSRFLRRVY